VNYAAAYQVISDAYRYDWSCEKVANELHAIGFSNERISKLMNGGSL
jgi:hypothetical protein